MPRFLLCALLALAAGCARSRTLTIYTRPSDAKIEVDGVDRGRGPITQTFRFTDPGETHRVVASRRGYKEEVRTVAANHPRDTLVIDLSPLTRRVFLDVSPVPAIVRINGKAVSASPVARVDQTLEFTLDADRRWTSHTVTAEREGYRTARREVSWTDRDQTYRLVMQPIATTKDVTITTDPPNVGAEIFVDGELRGTRRVELSGHPFRADPRTGRMLSQPIDAIAPGYEPGHAVMSLDDGFRQYVVKLLPKDSPRTPEPPGTMVDAADRKEGNGHSGTSKTRDVAAAAPGRQEGTVFVPTEKQGTENASPGEPFTSATAQGSAAKTTIDDPFGPPADTSAPLVAPPALPMRPGAVTDTRAGLAPTPGNDAPPARAAGPAGTSQPPTVVSPAQATARLPLLVAEAQQQGGERWVMAAKVVDAEAPSDTGEATGQPAPERILSLPSATVPAGLVASPDGSVLLFAALTRDADGSLRSRLQAVGPDGAAVPMPTGGGKLVDLTPSFSPDGRQIYFTSDRGGDGLKVWTAPADQPEAATQVTRNPGSADLWPVVDSSPKPRLFYQSMTDGRTAPTLFMAEVEPAGATVAANLNLPGAARPRVGPRADRVLYTAPDPRTGLRDVFMISYADGVPAPGSAVNLTNTPDLDESDPCWSRNGAKIAYAAARAGHPPDLWVMSAASPAQPTRVTTSRGWDDNPTWDPGGRSLYFRSNRGGTWGIWRIDVP